MSRKSAIKITLAGFGLAVSLLMSATPASAAAQSAIDFTSHWAGFAALAVFFVAYLLVIGEENLHLRKSKPVMLAAGIIWALVAVAYAGAGDTKTAEEAVRHNLLEFAELFLFLLAAMTFINTMDERGIFDALRSWLVSRGFSFRAIFWLTGLLSFVISPIADNLTTALLMATVILAVGAGNRKFMVVACVNIVIAANAGGAFSPFGDITTLMVWQKGIVEFFEFFALVVPSLVNWLVPAIIMNFVLPAGKPDAIDHQAMLQHGAWVVAGLFILTVAMAVGAHGFLHLPPVMGMMTGLGLLKFYGYYLKRRNHFFPSPREDELGEMALELETSSEPLPSEGNGNEPFNIFKALERAEWDTLMFFYGVILAIGGLGTFGYLTLGSNLLYGDLGPTTANVLVGFLSAIVDNIPVMFAVLSVLPEMDHGQWLLVTLTAGVGGSMLSIGSAAGVAVMGQARGIYTFVAHLKWSWAIVLGYAASIWAHLLINADKFQ
ncbi:MAG: sodium:proton antiporter NhaD [Rhodospirillales bacterium]|jgi:Na+/H+ antiporter NhaD/arsenite permease-like protein|nr:sodium:proton antiporter [Rhodospirillaceae bacterium]MDP6428916.1 sodium:proton antiporter NhaD [Rhodospirillales bacterium]MDP6644943.1 sodium:proton antiporter NhaD [Rhodospirillales bacterium]MDP6840521.1 sodium:proton antiporter NhaD [Rhodospirillales bacterium]